ncbi:MAG: tetratricopeptide repeat protein [Bryobacteraceae bacterium]|jgi:tetratricopeptide (TPR) repeat protein
MEQIRGFTGVRVLILFLLTVPGLLAQDSLSKAEDLYRRTDYQTSLTMMRESGQSSAQAFCLAGKDEFMLGDYKKASEAFERAFTLEPANADYALWLGRGFGRRAETASPFLAPRYAAKARGYFEKAVALDPKNEEALNDLFDYYLEAPGFLGGGFDKAEAIAKRIAEQNPAQGHFAQAQLADRRKQFDTAEQQLRRAIELAPRKVQRVLDLARYLAKHGRIPESEAAFNQAKQLAPDSPKVSFARAQTYIEQKRNLDQAKALLEQYLKSDLTPDDPSRQQAEKLLREASGV